MTTPAAWLEKLKKLKVDRATGDPAPHKPLLLLVVLETFEQGPRMSDLLPLTPELAFRFSNFWAVVAHRRKQPPDVRMPFHHLQSDGAWASLDEKGGPAAGPRQTRSARLAPAFLAAASEPEWRDRARRLLISHYFRPAEQLALGSMLGLDLPAVEEEEATAEASEAAREKGLAARFRLSVVAAYNYTCALTGYRLTTISGAAIVDAAHIHQFAHSRNNDADNGLALCKNAHWLFDNGLWTVAADYTVLVALSDFSEDSPDQKSLKDYHGQRLRLPGDSRLWPNPTHLSWHRHHRFRGRPNA
jgi:putative restriction endonuclease